MKMQLESFIKGEKAVIGSATDAHENGLNSHLILNLKIITGK